MLGSGSSSRGGRPLELPHRIFKLLLNGVQVRDQITAGVLDGFRWLLVIVSLALDLNAILEGMWLAIAGEFDSAVPQELVTDDVAQGVVLVHNGNNGETHLLIVDRHFLCLSFVLKHTLLRYVACYFCYWSVKLLFLL